jgi:hypothetical protein
VIRNSHAPPAVDFARREFIERGASWPGSRLQTALDQPPTNDLLADVAEFDLSRSCVGKFQVSVGSSWFATVKSRRASRVALTAFESPVLCRLLMAQEGTPERIHSRAEPLLVH